MTQHTRRQFLASLGVGALGLAGISSVPSCATGAPGSRKLKKIGVQLYTVRDRMQADMPGTLAQVAAAGYKEVEFAGLFGRTPSQARQMLDQNGLTSPSSHIGIERMEQDAAGAFAEAKALGNEWATVPYMVEQRRKTLDDWKRIASILNNLGTQAKASGLRLAYHNHDFEIRPLEGQRPYDILLSQTDPSLVDFEMDLYWVTFGGGSPLDFFNRYPGRFKMVHVKDSAGAPDNKMVDVGKGTINFPAIFAQSDKAGIEHYFVEHDQPADPIATIRNSAQYLLNLTY
ncbi:MAG TPA: sugar phosphate isomerase/epimerase [Gemmatimonadaceae bacterium]|nr:sugar phosphate isomerase/epimerase [Gemmatimonadaceae bacterium]